MHDPLNRKRYAAVAADGSVTRGTAKKITEVLAGYLGGPTNLEWATLRTLAGCHPVIVPTRRGGAWLYIERMNKHIYELRIINPVSHNRGRAKLVTAEELARVINRTRTKQPPSNNSP